MAVAFRSKTEGTNTTATGFTATEPSGAAENDILWLYVVIQAGMGTITPAAGWTELSSTTEGTTAVTKLYWIRRGASAPSLTWSWTSSAYFDYGLSAYSGCKTTGNPYNTYAASGTATANPSNPDPPSVTTTVDNCLIAVFGMGWSGWDTGGATPPSGYTLRYGTAVYDTGSADKLLASLGTENPGAFSNQQGYSATPYSSVTVALEPKLSSLISRATLLGVG